MATKKAILLDVKKNELRIVEDEFSLDKYYELIGCDCIDIVARSIGGRDNVYEIVCDDEGLLKEDITISAFSSYFEPQLVGNLLIFNGVDEEGDLCGCTEEDYEQIQKNIGIFDDHMVLMNVEY